MFANAMISAAFFLAIHRKSPLPERLMAQSRFAARNREILSSICGLRCEIRDADRLPQTPYVILSKHQSSYETLVFPCLFPPFVWVLKQSLVRAPFLGAALRRLGPIAIDRGRPQQALKQVLDQGEDVIGGGVNVLIFPEGTRYAPGAAGRYQVSGAALAQKNRIPIVPVAHDSGAYWGAYSFQINPGTIVVRIGAPIQTVEMEGKSAKEVTGLARERIEAMMGST